MNLSQRCSTLKIDLNRSCLDYLAGLQATELFGVDGVSFAFVSCSMNTTPAFLVRV